MNKRSKIKRGWIIVGLIVLVILVALAALYLWQQENIKSAANARKYTRQELQQQLEESRGSVQNALDKHPEITVRDLTQEERQMLRSGELDAQELVGMLTQSAQEQQPGADAPSQGSPAQPAPDATPTPADPPPDVTEAPEGPTQQERNEAAIAELVAQVYVMREQYTAQLDAMAAQARAEYIAMPQSERTRSKLVGWASGYISRASQLEKQCDAQMDAILEEMTRLLTESGGDLSLVQSMAYAYGEEKSIQKSIYIQELEKRGIM